MKSARILFVFVIASVAFAQAPEIVVRLQSGTKIEGRVAGLYREGAMIEDADGKTSLVRWEELPSLNPEQPVAVQPATATPLRRVNGAVPADDLACRSTPLAPKPLKGKIALSGTVRSGDVDSVLGALHAEATKDGPEDRIKAEIDALYGKTDGILTAGSFGGKARWDHFWSKTFYGYASLEGLYDSVQNLDLRAIASLGAGDFLWKKSEDCSWSVEGGLSALYEDFSTLSDPSLSPALRGATTFKRILFKDLKFEQEFEFLAPVDDFANYLARSKTRLGVPLCKDLALRFSLEMTYQGAPPAGTEPLQVLGLVGIEFQF